jgi:hypothetical protein
VFAAFALAKRLERLHSGTDERACVEHDAGKREGERQREREREGEERAKRRPGEEALRQRGSGAADVQTSPMMCTVDRMSPPYRTNPNGTTRTPAPVSPMGPMVSGAVAVIWLSTSAPSPMVPVMVSRPLVRSNCAA